MPAKKSEHIIGLHLRSVNDLQYVFWAVEGKRAMACDDNDIESIL